jgi:hypothetical protein
MSGRMVFQEKVMFFWKTGFFLLLFAKTPCYTGAA